MPLAIFDLDNTLLAGDSDYLWGQFLADLGIVDGPSYERENARFFAEYREGRLDILAFLRFSLRPLAQHRMQDLHSWRARFMREKIEPLITAAAEALVARHRAAGDTLMIVTATNAFVTAPIAERLGISQLIATDPEIVDGRFTGNVAGTPSFREGKVIRLQDWLTRHDTSLAGASFYSDSHNDLPLLELVERPVAVDPDPILTDQAKRRGWPIISLRGKQAPAEHRHL